MPRRLEGRDMYEVGRIATLLDPSGMGATHPPVSLDANTDNTFGIGVIDDPQELSLQTQAANVVWAGPAVGAPAVPTWRAIVAADLPGGFSGFANPTAVIGLAVINGILTTAMRSDAAPPLSQAIIPVWTGKHTFTAVNAIEIDIAAGDPVIILDTDGADRFTLGVDDSDGDRFKINSGATLADPSDLELDSTGNLDINGDYRILTGKGIVHADGVAAGEVLRANGTRYVPSGFYLTGTAGQTYTFGTTGGTIPTAAGTLTVATLNAISAAGVITHAITTTAVGAASTIMATDANGRTQVDGLGIGTAAVADNSIAVADNTWIGLGAAAGRIEFDDQAIDEINFLSCFVGIGLSTPETLLHLASSNTYCGLFLDAYDDGTAYPYMIMRKSDTDTIGNTVETDDGDNIGSLIFYGVDNTAAFDYGAYILATQEGASGARVPMRIQIATYSATAANYGIILNSAGRVGVNIEVGTHAGQLHVDQRVSDAGIPVLLLDQADVSEGCIDFVASARGAITGATNSVESVRVELNGAVYRLALYADA